MLWSLKSLFLSLWFSWCFYRDSLEHQELRKQTNKIKQKSHLSVFANVCAGALLQHLARLALNLELAWSKPWGLLRSFLSMYFALGMHQTFYIAIDTQVFLNILIFQKHSPQLLILSLRQYIVCFYHNLCSRCLWVVVSLQGFWAVPVSSLAWMPGKQNRDVYFVSVFQVVSRQVRADTHYNFWLKSAVLLSEPGTRVSHWEHGLPFFRHWHTRKRVGQGK